MALIVNFSSSESLSANNIVTFTDTSTGEDLTVTTRHISVLLSDGTYLVPAGTTTNYIVWDYADSSIVVDLLTKSTVANVTVEWIGDTTYTKTILMEWNLYDYVFLFGLLQTQTSNPTIINDTNYYGNVMQMIVNLFQSESATTNMDDAYSAQSALDRNQRLMNNQSKYF